MKFSYFNKFVLALILLMASSVSAQIDLPFDYFYGRWVDGHYLNSSFHGTEFDWYHNSSNYSFTNNSLQVKINDIGDHLLWDKDGDYKNSASFDINYRINNHWQIGLNGLKIVKNDSRESISYSNEIKYNLTNENTYKYITLISKFMNKDVLQIQKRHGAYAYHSSNIIFKGEFLIENSIAIFDASSTNIKTYYDYYQLPLANIPIYYANNNNSSRYLFSNRFQYGITDDINLILQINHQFYKIKSFNTSERFYKQTAPNENRVVLTDSFAESKLKRPSYKLSLIIGNFKPFYIETFVTQNFLKQYSYSNIYESASDTSVVISEKLRNDDLQEYSTTMNIKLTYLRDNNFDFNIIKDDYNNYYYNMIGKNQLLISNQMSYNKSGDSQQANLESFKMSMKAVYGLTEKLNLDATWNYSYIKYPEVNYSLTRSRQSIQYNFGFKYRSFLYDALRKRWETDSKDDIQFGGMLKAGEYFVQLQYTPPGYQESSKPHTKIFAINKMYKYGNSSLVFNSTIGLGRKTEISFNHDRTFNDGEDLYNYKLDFRKRVLQVLNVSIGIEKNNYK